MLGVVIEMYTSIVYKSILKKGVMFIIEMYISFVNLRDERTRTWFQREQQ
jgi:hypothetical protein